MSGELASNRFDDIPIRQAISKYWCSFLIFVVAVIIFHFLVASGPPCANTLDPSCAEYYAGEEWRNR